MPPQPSLTLFLYLYSFLTHTLLILTHSRLPLLPLTTLPPCYLRWGCTRDCRCCHYASSLLHALRHSLPPSLPPSLGVGAGGAGTGTRRQWPDWPVNHNLFNESKYDVANIWMWDVFLLSDASTFGAGVPTKTRLEFNINKFKPRLVYDTAFQAPWIRRIFCAAKNWWTSLWPVRHTL